MSRESCAAGNETVRPVLTEESACSPECESASFEIDRLNGDIYTVLVDAEDLDRVLAAGPWQIVPPCKRSRTAYVKRSIRVDGKRTTQKLHQFLVDAGHLQVDHINGNGLDNRRSCNLRVATCAENAHNRGALRSNRCGYKGVYLDRRSGLWRASIMLDGRRRNLGHFASPELAHEAYCTAAAELHGEFARIA